MSIRSFSTDGILIVRCDECKNEYTFSDLLELDPELTIKETAQNYLVEEEGFIVNVDSKLICTECQQLDRNIDNSDDDIVDEESPTEYEGELVDKEGDDLDDELDRLDY
jgi:hypothetical protein